MMQLDPAPRDTLAERLTCSLAEAIAAGRLPPGARLPSIRSQARASGVSTFTVVEVYGRLAARGLIDSRPGAGHFVRARPRPPIQRVPPLTELPVDEHWLLHNVYQQPGTHIAAGCGWLPPDWYDAAIQQRALRSVARTAGPDNDYGDPRGLPALRAYLARDLAEREVPASSDTVVLTQGASSALNIAAAALARPGDTVLVDDPGYCNLISSLRFHGYQVVGVPWTEQGPDTEMLADLLARYRPRVFFTNPWLHNPTGASYASRTAHRVLQLAEQYQLTIVEDNVSSGLVQGRQPVLAAMDGLNRVIYIGSFSKTLSPALRVGFFAARPELVERMTRFKMMTGMTTPQLNERLALAMLQESRQRRQQERLRTRLADAQCRCAERLEQLGWRLFTRPQNGLFLLAAPPQTDQDSLPLATLARQQGILLAPGALFHPHGGPSPWLRFNVAYSQHEALWRFLSDIGKGGGTRPRAVPGGVVQP